MYYKEGKNKPSLLPPKATGKTSISLVDLKLTNYLLDGMKTDYEPILFNRDETGPYGLCELCVFIQNSLSETKHHVKRMNFIA